MKRYNCFEIACKKTSGRFSGVESHWNVTLPNDIGTTFFFLMSQLIDDLNEKELFSIMCTDCKYGLMSMSVSFVLSFRNTVNAHGAFATELTQNVTCIRTYHQHHT